MATPQTCVLVGAPVEAGASQPGCLMGPDALRTAGIAGQLAELGCAVVDRGNVAVETTTPLDHPNPAVRNLADIAAWTGALATAAYRASGDGFPIFLGGDHSISLGTVPGVARRAGEQGRDFFVLWLDAHPDLHDLDSTRTGNLHGTPVAYFTGLPGFAGALPPPPATVEPKNICMMGIRSIDAPEHERLLAAEVQVHDMRAVDEGGVAPLLRAFLERVRAAGGALHLSLDVDFLDPGIAPAVGTTVPGGATFREAHLIMEMLHDSGLVTSLDIVELNPFLDERGRTAKLLVELTASLFGRRVMDRPTRSY